MQVELALPAGEAVTKAQRVQSVVVKQVEVVVQISLFCCGTVTDGVSPAPKTGDKVEEHSIDPKRLGVGVLEHSIVLGGAPYE